MVNIELFPDLSHCVETQAKKQYEEIMKKLLAAELYSEEAERRLELLHLFLEKTDFKDLRRESEKYLVEGKQVKFTIYLEAGKPQYRMEVA